MSFETLSPLISYPSDGVATEFAIPDKFYDARDVKVFFVDSVGLETPYVPGTDFSVVITASDPTPPARKSGKAVFPTPPVAGGDVVVFVWPDNDQDQQFEGQPVTPRQNERVHDRHAMRDAALRELLFRGYRSPLNADPGLRFIVAGRQGYVPTWDAAGNLVEGPTVGQVATVAQFIGSINTVAAIEAQVVTLANLDDEISLLASKANDISTVAAISGSVVNVSAHTTEISTVASNIIAVTGVYEELDAILAAPGAAQDAAQEANQAADRAEAAEVNVATSAVPLGTPMPILTNTLPAGYLWLEGGTYDPLVYPDFAAYMVAGGYTSGQLPDWRNRVPRGLGSLTSAIGSLQEDAGQRLTGQFVSVGGRNSPTKSGVFNSSVSSGSGIAGSGGTDVTLNFDSGNSPGARVSDDETRVKAFIVRWAIKAYGAIVNQGTADLVAIEQGYETLSSMTARYDIDQNAQGKSTAFKINILKNTLQAWEVVPGGKVALGSNVSEVLWTGLGDYLFLRMTAILSPVNNDASPTMVLGAGTVDTAANYDYALVYANNTNVSGVLNLAQSLIALTGPIGNGGSAYYGLAKIDIANFNRAQNAHVISNFKSVRSGSTRDTGIYSGTHATSVARNVLSIRFNTGQVSSNSRFLLEGMRG
jgi:hypothetical protein